jgi:hypothetical protein
MEPPGDSNESAKVAIARENLLALCRWEQRRARTSATFDPAITADFEWEDYMARLIFLSASTPALGHLFTVDHAVGLHGVNHVKDVLLVQFFLRALIRTPPGAPAVPLDGHCGRQTIKWIRYFQTAYGSGGSCVRGPGQRVGNRNNNNLQQIGVSIHNSDGSVRSVGGGSTANPAVGSDGSVRFIGGGSTANPAVRDGASNTVIVGESTGTSTANDGSSNTIVIGEQPPANADPHVHRHYGTIRPPQHGEPFETNMTIVRLNRAYRESFGPDRFRRIDLDPVFPRELFAAFFGNACGF